MRRAAKDDTSVAAGLDPCDIAHIADHALPKEKAPENEVGNLFRRNGLHEMVDPNLKIFIFADAVGAFLQKPFRGRAKASGIGNSLFATLRCRLFEPASLHMIRPSELFNYQGTTATKYGKRIRRPLCLGV